VSRKDQQAASVSEMCMHEWDDKAIKMPGGQLIVFQLPLCCHM